MRVYAAKLQISTENFCTLFPEIITNFHATNSIICWFHDLNIEFQRLILPSNLRWVFDELELGRETTRMFSGRL